MGSEDDTNVRAFLGMERFPWESCRDGRESRRVKSTVVWAQNTVGAAVCTEPRGDESQAKKMG